jgi:aspartate-semialdehyde dehydrogenase
VGTLMLRLLRERAFPASEIVAFASARSVWRVLEGAGAGGNDLTVQGLAEESIQGFDLALFSAGGSTSGEWAPRFAAAGAVVVDNSSRWRMQDDVPLVVSDVNPEALAGADPSDLLNAVLRRGRHSLAESVCGSGPLVSSPALTMFETSAAIVPRSAFSPLAISPVVPCGCSLTYPMMRPSMSSLC